MTLACEQSKITHSDILQDRKLPHAFSSQVQRFRLCLMRFKHFFTHIPGKNLTTAETPSCLLILRADSRDVNYQKEVEALVDLTMKSLPATSIKLEEIKKMPVQDKVCTEI